MVLFAHGSHATTASQTLRTYPFRAILIRIFLNLPNNVCGFQSKGRAAKIYSLGSTLDAVNLDELPIKTIFLNSFGACSRSGWLPSVGTPCGLRVNVIMADLAGRLGLVRRVGTGKLSPCALDWSCALWSKGIQSKRKGEGHAGNSTRTRGRGGVYARSAAASGLGF